MQETTILSYFFGASGVVKAVMLILLMASIFSWALIFQRAWYFRQKQADYKAFKASFMNATDLSALYNTIDNRVESRVGVANIFYAGYKAFSQGLPLDAIQRVMHICHAKEEGALEAHLPWFASIGSVSPYVGLFGTVWGIMASLQALGHAKQATIAMVAPGISEALVATALGLFTAIPAFIAFNRYNTRASRLLDQYDVFQEELLALIVQQQKAASK